MGYIKEDEVLLYETLCSESPQEYDRRAVALKLFKENLKLVPLICKKFYSRDPAIEYEDILQTGYMGLYEACLAYDESKGYKLSTIAGTYIEGRVFQMFRNHHNGIKTPPDMKKFSSILKKRGFTIPLSDEEVAILIEEENFSAKKINSYSLFLGMNIFSMDTNYSSESEGVPFSATIPDPTSYFDREFTEDEIEAIVDKIVGYVHHKYRDIAEEWIYSVLAGKKVSSRELGVKYGCTYQWIQVVLSNAIALIRLHREEIQDMLGI